MKKPSLPDISPLESHLGFWLRLISNQVSGNFEKLLREQDISVTEWVAMRTLYQRNDVGPSRLQTSLGMTKGAASKIISRLESKSLVERRLADNSARDQLLSLTKKGNQLLPALAALADQNDEAFFGHLPSAQRAELAELMQALASHHQLTQVPLQ